MKQTEVTETNNGGIGKSARESKTSTLWRVCQLMESKGFWLKNATETMTLD